MQLWQGRFSKAIDKKTNDFNSSISFDSRMFREDIEGSIAHADMLGTCGIIDRSEADRIIGGLRGILADIENGTLQIDMEAEDIHTFVEGELTARLGSTGKRLHTSRSRNDQVALDIRLNLRKQADGILADLKELIGVICDKAEQNADTVMPGYTHLQRAQPITFGHHLLAYAEMLLRDVARIEDAKKRVGTESASFEATIEKLEQTRLLLEKDRTEAAVKLRQAEENAKKAAMLRAELEVRLEKADLRSRREAERILNEAKETAEQTFRELDEMRRRANEEEDAQRVNEARSELRRRLNQSKDALRRQDEPVQAEQRSARPVKPGDTVQIKSMGMKAEVVAVSPERVLTLRAGIMNVTAKEDEVLLVEGAAPKPKKAASAASAATLRSAGLAQEIDLRGMEAIEAVLAAERYLDSAVMARLKTVTIIHGKGTGALRSAVQDMLRHNKSVKSFRLGRFGEGESGVTVVELK